VNTPIEILLAAIFVVLAGFIYGFARGFIRAVRSDPERHEIWVMTKALMRRRNGTG
jgi:FlaG/FlaF family flagellin (archaellin)